MKNTNWKSSPPPSLGWWPTIPADDKLDEIPGERYAGYRWWDGKSWSADATMNCSEYTAESHATTLSVCSNEEILWGDRPSHWPERSKT